MIDSNVKYIKNKLLFIVLYKNMLINHRIKNTKI
jgi:hypothetical protein